MGQAVGEAPAVDFALALPQLHLAPVDAKLLGKRDRRRVVARLELMRPMKLAALEHVQTIFLHFPPRNYRSEIAGES